jgi:hypothetical protein
MKADISEHLYPSAPLPTASSYEAENLRRLISKRFPFLEYAVRNVLYHADVAEGGGVAQDAFIDNFPLRDWINLDNIIEKYQIRRHTPKASLLYILAEKNLPKLIGIQVRRVTHIDIEGERYCFPILAALVNGNKNAVRALLAPDADPQSIGDGPHNLYSQYYQDLIALLEYGHDIKLRKGQTLLSYAAEHGNTRIVQQLLTAGRVNPDSNDSGSGWTSLLRAAVNVHEAVVRLLLATERVDPESKDSVSGRTPLSLAAQNGHEEVVRLLLEKSVNPDSKDGIGQTPLSLAAQNGQGMVVRLLLATERVDPDSQDMNGWTPLLWAKKNCHQSMMNMLIAST